MKEVIEDICIKISSILTDHSSVESIALQKENFIPYIKAHPWDTTSLSHGLPGLICLFSAMEEHFQNPKWAEISHQAIEKLIFNIQKNGISNSSLFAGLSGICYSILIASKDGTRYSTLLKGLNSLLVKKIEEEYLQNFEEQSNQLPFPCPPIYYDYIAGLSGILSYLLCYAEQQTEIRPLIERCLRVLIHISQDKAFEGENIPGWYIAPKHMIHEEQQSLFPSGIFDTGLAHGAAGCLALLSKAYLKGFIIDGQKEAIEHIVYWIKSVRQDVGPIEKVWPGKILYVKDRADYSIVRSHFYRDGWCYGAPGIASALLTASKALQDEELYKYAVESMSEACARDEFDPNLECVSFCHGWASLLSATQLFYLETEDLFFLNSASRIAERIMMAYKSELPFGFKCYASAPYQAPILIDNPGLLDGVTGTLLSLLFHISEKKRAPPFLSIFFN